MRMIMQVEFPLDPFSTLVRNGTIGATMKKLLEATKPEAAYFSETDGNRGGILIVDLTSPSDVPKLAEPWFLTLDAKVRFRIAMTPDDLGRSGLDSLGAQWS
jgi:hypothetical protein